MSCGNKTADTVDTDQFLKAPSSFIIRVVWSYLSYEQKVVLMYDEAQDISKLDAAASSIVGSIINNGTVDRASVVVYT